MTDLVWTVREVLLARALRRAQAGDREAFRSLYRSLHPVVWRFVLRRCRVEAEAEEIVGQTFFRLLEKLPRVDAAKGVRGYVLAIAANALIDAARERSRRGEAVLERVADPSATPLEQLTALEERQRLGERLQRLPPATRQLLALRFADGLRFSEIAHLTGLSEAAARQRLSRAVRELREGLEPGGQEVAHEP